jgi:hypothetical protein
MQIEFRNPFILPFTEKPGRVWYYYLTQGRDFMRNTRVRHTAWAVALTCLLSLLASGELFAQGSAPAEAGYNVAASLKDNLSAFTGKDVYVSLRSGKVYQGYVKAVGENFVHLEKIAGKEYFDALIRIRDISAIEARFRGPK